MTVPFKTIKKKKTATKAPAKNGGKFQLTQGSAKKQAGKARKARKARKA